MPSNQWALRAGLALAISLPTTAAHSSDEDTAASEHADKQVPEEVVVIGLRQRLYQAGALKDVIQKTEMIDEEVILSRQAVNLTKAIEQSPGVRVSNECSMCGVKRVMLNGMRGEHTTVLTDGMPLHTMLAGYYALDAIPTTGVARIEVARGAGASLIAPEAIGGTVNIISKEPTETALELNFSAENSDDGGHLAGGFGSYVSPDERTRASLTLQLDQHGQLDGDRNGVSEAPLLENQNIIARISHDFSDYDNVILRIGVTDSEVFGGPTGIGIGSVLSGFDGVESDQLFVNDDVREQFIGKPWETTEWIDSERRELSAVWLHEFSSEWNSTLSLAHTNHEQDSFYEGFDYKADNQLTYIDVRNNLSTYDNHLLTFGIDLRDEQMRSDSLAGEASDNYIEDSFDYRVIGLYLQDTWLVSDALEVALALRADTVKADFVAEQKPGTEIDRTLLAPRVDARYLHNDQWTSRLSAGIGYRAPLSFFETDHGILDAGDGFAIDVNELETSTSLNYALSFEGERLSATLSLAYTDVENLAALDETEDGVPLLTQIEGSASVRTADLALGYQVNDWLTVGSTFETFSYEDSFRESFAIAPATERVVLTADMDMGGWQFYTTASYTGSRDLGRYGYEGSNIADGSAPKSLSGQSFWVVDVRLEKMISDRLSVYAGAANLFDWTQVKQGETPLFWDADGGYDVAYIYGPMRGQEFFAGVQLSF